MVTFEQPTFRGEAYQPQEEVYYNDGREIDLLHFIFNHPDLEQMRGHPKKVIAAIDEYGRTKKYLMNIGEYKAKIVVDLIEERKPEIMVELGAYVGYSAISFAAALRSAGGKRYYSLEHNAEFGAVTTMLIDLAGLSDIVKVIIGNADDTIRRLHSSSELLNIDLLFLDHLKHLYTPDLKLCEDLGLVGVGSVYAADNVVKPGNPPYLEYVRSTVEEKKKRFAEASHGERKGNPDLKYESQFIEGWEPSGVPVRGHEPFVDIVMLTKFQDALEITRCVGI